MNVPIHQHWIGGRFVEPSLGEYFDDLNPLDHSLYAHTAKGPAEDIRNAVEAANATFQSYRKSLPKDREAWLIRAAE